VWFKFGKKGEQRTLELCGVKFPIVKHVEDFCDKVLSRKSCALLIETIEFQHIYHAVMTILIEKRDKSTAAMVMAQDCALVCAKCHFLFPGSFQMRLLFGRKMPFKAVGAIRDGDEFGRTGICPECGSRQALFVADFIDPKSVTEADVKSIRELWRFRAQQWWKIEESPPGTFSIFGPPASRSFGFCDSCNAEIPKGSGYLSGSSLLCSACVDRLLSVVKLRENPHAYGWGELRRARALACNRPT